MVKMSLANPRSSRLLLRLRKNAPRSGEVGNYEKPSSAIAWRRREQALSLR